MSQILPPGRAAPDFGLVTAAVSSTRDTTPATELAVTRRVAAGLCSLGAAVALGGPSAAQGPRPVALVVVDVHAVALGYRVSQLIHRPVRNDQGAEIGKIDDLIIGRDKVLFVVIGVGGFLGVGEHLVAVPYDQLVVTPQRILLHGATKEALRGLPQFRYAG